VAKLLRLDEAQRLILERARRLDIEDVRGAEAAGRVLAEAAVARTDLPPFPSSAMDGFALRSADTEAAPVSLPVVARVAAGSPAERPLRAGEAMAIATGGVVPEGADAVIPLERVEESGDEIRVTEAVAAGAHVRRRGGDARAGETILEQGATLGAAQVGALAAAGVAEVRCARRPRVAVLVTGSELQAPGEPLEPGQIYEANGPLLTAALGRAGARVEPLGVAADDPAELAHALEQGLAAADLLVTAGGASVGPHDLVRETQARLGVEEVFWGVAVKPGKPTAFGVRDECLVFNLPGNPVSALVTFELFVRPALAALAGVPDPLPTYARGTLARSVRRDLARDEFVRAVSTRRGDEVVLEPVTGQESHMIARAARADALVAVEAGEGKLREGETVRFLRLL
jgi:molybdopterin molybdotransferase